MEVRFCFVEIEDDAAADWDEREACSVAAAMAAAERGESKFGCPERSIINDPELRDEDSC